MKTEENGESEILSSVSVAQRHKTKRLLEYLKNVKDVQIGEKGQLNYKDQKIHQSHVGDRLNDIL